MTPDSPRISFFVEGNPVGQPRPRFNGHHAYTPKGPIDGWKQALAWGCKAHRPKKPMLGPVKVWLTFWMPRPKSHLLRGMIREGAPEYHCSKPDIDNLAKAVLDVLTKQGFYEDDSQVCGASFVKVYPAAHQPLSGVGVTIS
jgi:Holliday junction resolvase RusA-like endonuclease